MIEVRQDLVRVQRTWRGEEHLIEMRRQPERRGVVHRVERAAPLVGGRLHAAQWKSALAAGPPPAKPAAAIVPVSDTATFFTSGCTGAAASSASKSFLPSELVTAGR